MNTINEKTEAQAQMLANRLQKRFRHLKKWAQRTGTGAFRLYDRDIPEVPLVLDFYGDAAQPKEAAICGALYKRPYEKDETDEDNWLAAMKAAAARALEIDIEYIFLKQRQKQKGTSQYEKVAQARFEKIVSEGDLSFKVNLSDYLDTGLFSDRRLLRSMVRREAAGKKVLNLFSYTSSFSVYAAAGNAASTDSVDLSNTYLSWARENFSLNGLSAQMMQVWDFFSGSTANMKAANTGANKLIRADVLEFLEKAAKAARKWDIIILDPPSFSNSKKMTSSFDLRRDYVNLISRCLTLLASGGKLFFSANTHSFKTNAEELEAELSAQFTASENKLHITDIADKITDEDFKNRKMPKSFIIRL